MYLAIIPELMIPAHQAKLPHTPARADPLTCRALNSAVIEPMIEFYKNATNFLKHCDKPKHNRECFVSVDYRASPG